MEPSAEKGEVIFSPPPSIPTPFWVAGVSCEVVGWFYPYIPIILKMTPNDVWFDSSAGGWVGHFILTPEQRASHYCLSGLEEVWLVMEGEGLSPKEVS
jgi:hypothetical protein